MTELFDELVRAGHGAGHRDVADRLTWRQIEAFWQASEHRRARGISLLFGGDG
ncbi:MAG: hypothetical protein OXH64_00065 [Rhodospirillaceae bacterium]|nr:hypothetical protein [Rhodospirillaceae bacterium]